MSKEVGVVFYDGEGNPTESPLAGYHPATVQRSMESLSPGDTVKIGDKIWHVTGRHWTLGRLGAELTSIEFDESEEDVEMVEEEESELSGFDDV